MQNLLNEIKKCTVCLPFLENGVNPVVSVSEKSRVLVIGQAPGSIVHKTGIPWDDKSGERLREWMNVDSETFYNNEIFGIVPMGFCYPGKGKIGDNPPRKECAPLYHKRLINHMPNNLILIYITHTVYFDFFRLGMALKGYL